MPLTRIPRQSCQFGGFTHRGAVVLRWSNDWRAGRYSGTDHVWACLRHTRTAFAVLRTREASHARAVQASGSRPGRMTAGYPYSPCSCGVPAGSSAQCFCRHPASNYPPQ